MMLNRHLADVRTVASVLGRSPVRPAVAAGGAHRAVPGTITAHHQGASRTPLVVPGMRKPRLSAGAPSNLPFVLVGALLAVTLFVSVAYLAAPAPAIEQTPPSLTSPPAIHAKGHLR